MTTMPTDGLRCPECGWTVFSSEMSEESYDACPECHVDWEPCCLVPHRVMAQVEALIELALILDHRRQLLRESLKEA